MTLLRYSRFRALWLVLGFMAASGAAQARNEKLMLPLAPALRSQGSQMLGRDIQLHFGKGGAGGEVITLVEGHGVGDPFKSEASPYGRRDKRPDAQVCLDAFRKAVMAMQDRARAAGAAAIVGIVSNYEHREMDSRDMYECHAGNSRAVVDLRGQAVRSAGLAQAQPLQPATRQPQGQVYAPAPTAAAPIQIARPVQPVEPAPAATGFAQLADVDAIPYLSDKGRAAYREYLTHPTPKAFAISPSGYWFKAWSLTPMDKTMPTDPVERAVVACNRAGSPTPCRLYAVNGSVVWTREAAK